MGVAASSSGGRPCSPFLGPTPTFENLAQGSVRPPTLDVGAQERASLPTLAIITWRYRNGY